MSENNESFAPSVRDLHNAAMQAADKMFIAFRAGNFAVAERLAAEAANLEAQAAHSSPHQPQRSILFRSAASLALNANQFDEAEALVNAGLAGGPPPSYRKELEATLKIIKRVRRKAGRA